MAKDATLVFPVHKNFLGERVALGLKYVRSGSEVGKGTFCGAGGKCHTGESIRACATREMSEEFLVHSPVLRPRGAIHFILPHVAMNVSLYVATKWCGEISPGDEFEAVRWFSFDEIPYENMLPDYACWFEHILAGRCVHGTIRSSNASVIWQDIKVTDKVGR